MAADSKTRNEEKTSRDVPRFKSELEDIDFALFRFLDETMDVRTKTNKGFKKVPVISFFISNEMSR